LLVIVVFTVETLQTCWWQTECELAMSASSQLVVEIDDVHLDCHIPDLLTGILYFWMWWWSSSSWSHE